MKQGSLFYLSCGNLPNHGASSHALGFFGKLSMNMGAPTWFENVWNYDVEVLFDYWTIFFYKLNKIETRNCTGIWGVLCVARKSLMS